MVDEFEKSAVSFKGELPTRIKNLIRSQLSNINGSVENMEGYSRAKYLQDAQALTGLELKRLQNYIDSLSRNGEGKITNPAYNLIGGDALHTFIKQESTRLRQQINSAEELQKDMGKTEKQDVSPPAPPNFEKATDLPRLGLELDEQIKRIKKIITY